MNAIRKKTASIMAALITYDFKNLGFSIFSLRTFITLFLRDAVSPAYRCLDLAGGAA